MSLHSTFTDPLPPAVNCWFLTGPTASGKTKIGVELAERLGAEIVAMDSMTLYQGLDIGTAKPTAVEQAQVKHHLLDLVPPTEDFSLSQYVAAAHAAIAEIKSRGREVLFVGGTPLYLKALLRGVFQGPPADWAFREQIEQELQTLPLAALHQRLNVIDPLLASKLHPNDKRRIIRGLEVFKLTGRHLSHLQTQFDEVQPASSTRVFVLAWPRAELFARIDERVDQMFASGLVAEVAGLIARYGKLSRTAMQAVGYREVLDYLEGTPKNEALSACVERVKFRTHQFVRRQETWFRSLGECLPIAMNRDFAPAQAAELILSITAQHPPAAPRQP